MKNIISSIVATASRFDKRYIQLVLVILALVLTVLGAGAPEAGGGLCG